VATTRADPRAHRVLRSTLEDDEENDDDYDQTDDAEKARLAEPEVVSPDGKGILLQKTSLIFFSSVFFLRKTQFTKKFVFVISAVKCHWVN